MTLKSRTYSTARPLFNQFFPANVLTVVTGRDMDFMLNPAEDPFTHKQKEWLEALFETAPGNIANVKQVHGNKIIRVDGPCATVVEADGLITDRTNLPLVVRTADCLPVFLIDVKTPAAGIVHAGWRGTKDTITLEAVNAMIREFNSRPEDIKAAFGPCIRPRQYEVGPEFCQHFPQEVVRENQKYYFDLALANKNQLVSRGVLEENIYDCRICTFEDQNYHSYRRDGQAAGRILSMIMIRK